MAGLVPAIHVLPGRGAEDVDARDKPGHDDLNCTTSVDHPVSTTLTLCERSSASRTASGAAASGRCAVTSDSTSTLPPAIRSTAVKNSMPKRNEPRRSISLDITAFDGVGICPPGRLPTCTTTPP